ncbi:MAG TPA: TonB family protein [Candidatus Sulfopaludibacter sp.]|nr:TonB family protein [Candidatus Sulfopaludibacter sp.]
MAQKPISVALPYAVIDRLEKEVVESFRSLTSRGSEIGGLLLGAVTRSNSSIVSIDDFELIACDYSRGPLYRLSDADMGRFERALEEQQRGNGARVVGYFRSHTRKGLSLDAEDVSFLDARFREAYQVALLVRPYATKPSTAGIFIRENGVINAEASYLEFPFRSSQLSMFKGGSAAPESAAASSPAPPAPAIAPPTLAPTAIPSAPKPAARAQIVPIASRREVTLPAPPPAEPPAKEPVAVAPPEAPKPAPTVKEKSKEKDKANKDKAPEKAAAPVEEKTAAKPEAKPEVAHPEVKKAEPAAAAIVAEPEVKAPKSKAGLIAGVVAAAALVLTGLFVYPGFLRRGSLPTSGQSAPSLSLRVERTGTDILLTWNRDSDGIKTAQRAVLSIFDGDRHENYDMDLGQLRNGSIVYSPITADVSFRMDVMRPGKAAPISESVRVLRTRPSAMGDGGQPVQAVQTKPGVTPPVKTPGSADAAPDAAADTAAADDSKPSTLVKPTKNFDAASLVKRLRPATPTEAVDAPSINPNLGQASAPSSISGLNMGGVAPAPPSAAAPPSAPAVKTPVATGGQIRTAELVTRKEPEYPKLARQMGVKGIVELTATIGADGRVKTVKVEKGHPLLTKAASEAVMQWIYRPCMLNGQAVQSDTRISLNFVGER